MADARSSGHWVRTIRLDDNALGSLLDSMDGAASVEVVDKESVRYAYRNKALVVRMQQPGSSIDVAYSAPTRSLSAKTLTFLHGGFVHVGTNCVAQLITVFGTWNDVSATVVSCHYVDVNIHEVTITFDCEIDPSIYCLEAVQSRVLLVEDDPATARLATFHLKKLNARIDHAKDGESAIDQALSDAYDVILMDMAMPGMDGFAAVAELRKRGVTGRIVALTGLTQPEDRQRCLEAGCSGYLAKPYTREDLERLLQSLREEPLFSSLHNDPSMAELIETFISALPARVRAIEEGVVAGDLEKLQSAARALKGEGTSYGFEVITESAGLIESNLLQGAGIEQVRPQADALVRLCLQVRSPAFAQNAKGN